MKFKNMILLVFGFLIIQSCVKLEEETPGQLTTDSLYKTQTDFETAVIGLYSPLFGDYAAFDFDWPLIMTAGGEDIDSEAGIFKNFDELRVDPASSSIATMWKALYKSINNANVILGNLDKSEFSGEALGHIEGQARFMRAFCYFYLTRWFGEIQVITYENQGESNTVAQSSFREIYDFIVADLKIAEEKLPASFSEIGRTTKGAAKGLLAKAYLTMGGWPLEDASQFALARDKAREVMDMGVYQLENDFAELWKAENKFSNSEFIFILQGISSAGAANASHLHIASRPIADNGWGDFYTEERFLNAFPKGPRKEASFRLTFHDGSTWDENNVPGGGPGHPFIAKYRNAGGPCVSQVPGNICLEDGDGFFPALRYADILLIYAEAANLAGGSPFPEAIEAVNQVKRRAAGEDIFTPNTDVDLPNGISSTAFDEAVLAERNWELAFEGKRWFDLVRRKMVVEVNSAIHGGVTETDRLLPKPTLQVDLSEGLQQNDGY